MSNSSHPGTSGTYIDGSLGVPDVNRDASGTLQTVPPNSPNVLTPKPSTRTQSRPEDSASDVKSVTSEPSGSRRDSGPSESSSVQDRRGQIPQTPEVVPPSCNISRRDSMNTLDDDSSPRNISDKRSSLSIPESNNVDE